MTMEAHTVPLPALRASATETPKVTKPPKPKALVDLAEDDCRWPVVDQPQYLFCAAPKLEGLPYCAAHCRIAYAKERSQGLHYPLRAFQK
jgi:GcrA cell cycle regulator